MIKPSPSIDFIQHPHFYVQRSIPIGKRLVIIAEADDGPLYEPILVYHKDMAINFFGGGDLVRSYEDASTFQEGLPVYLMRMEPLGYKEAFFVLEAFTFDLLFLNEVHFDKHIDVIEMFLDFCKTKEEKGNIVHGITTLSSSMNYMELLPLFPLIEDLTKDISDDLEELGKYLSIVTNQIDLKDAGAVYAGTLISLEPEMSPVNKTIPNVSLNSEFDNEEIKSLRSVGIVCFKSTFKKGVTCTSSSCAVSTEGSVHKHISNFRIAQYLINQISIELQPLVGMPNPAFQTMHVEDVVDSVCLEHVTLNRIRDYDYQILVNEIQGIIDVGIEIVPIFSVHSMTAHSRVRVFK